MSSPFDLALAQADATIEQTIMTGYVINGTTYQAVYDEIPREIDPTGYSGSLALNGSYRTLTLFKTQGYKPKRGDVVEINSKRYAITGFGYRDGYLILQVE
ncbi:hypothetical protein [Pasteurella bettyae]|uniref:hypothetical protein n=1 Tax=Pasteurella bettyae TaxID=752 RepID=UPI003D2DEEDE